MDHVYVSFDEDCEYLLETSDVLKNPDCTDPLELYVYDQYGEEIPGDLLTNRYRGYKLVFRVVHDVMGTENSCWGYVTPEDKWAPIAECRDTLLNCWDARDFLGPLPNEDNCGYNLEFHEVSKTWVDFNCENDTAIGYVQRSVITVDTWGNSSRCDSQRIFILREYLDSLVCPDSVVTIECCDILRDETGAPVLDASGNEIYKLWHPDYAWEDADGYSHPIPRPDGAVKPPYISTDNGPHYIQQSNEAGKCNILTSYKDHIIPTCGHSYKIRREYKIFDWCTGEDTTCVQWIKILDTIPPVLKPADDDNPTKEICLDYLEVFESSLNGTCEDVVTATDITDYAANVYYVKSHDCVAHVELERPMIMNECGFKFAKGDADKIAEEEAKIKVSYLIKYQDPKHPGSITTLTGDIAYGETETVYLPAGWFTVVYYVTDECWNEAYACEIIGVVDIIPPTPVCDEITTTTLDPDSCWTRVYAEDLDDGSNDNCSHKLHFAVANMDTIEFYREYWKEQLIECHDEYTYEHHQAAFEALIERWINCYIFNDYIDVSECGTEMLVVRVYEAHGMPVYDPHKFVGTKHQWFCFALYDEYACFFKFNYDGFAKYENPRDNLCGFGFNELTEEFSPPLLVDTECQCGFTSNIPPADSVDQFPPFFEPNACIPCETALPMDTIPADPSLAVGGGVTSTLIAQDPFGESFYHGPFRNRSCCAFEQPGNTNYPAWLELVEKYPELDRLDCSRYQFQHLYNDCMIELIKDDKTPPICYPPEVMDYYCDGVPVKGSFYPNMGNDLFCWNGAQFAHDICEESDTWTVNCKWDITSDAGSDVCDYAPGSWCVTAPWDGGSIGYYGGPSMTGYTYNDPCGEDLSAWFDSHKPIYCRFWLMLDRYDLDYDQKYDPFDYFGDFTIHENCWDYTVDTLDEANLDECNVGYVSRTLTVTDKCGNTTECYATLAIRPRSDFEVKFPEDRSVDCEDPGDLSPIIGDSTTYPVVYDDDCEQIGITYADVVLDVQEDGCFKILRTWKIIDWCVYNPDIQDAYRYPDVIVDDRCVANPDRRPCVVRNLKDDGDGFMTYLQVITVVDDVAPVVTCNPIEICIFDEDCETADANELIGEATDNCTEELEYRYTIKPFGSDDESTWIFGHGNIVQNTLPIGDHKIVLYAHDDCGNEGFCEEDLIVRDCKLPTPYCFNGIATVVMPSSGEVTVWAKDLDAGSFDNCTPADSLCFTFSSTPPSEDETYSAADYSSSMVFTCDDLSGGTNAQIEVEIYVWDESGNFDFCQTYILLQVGSDTACADISTVNNSEKSSELLVQNGEKGSGISTTFGLTGNNNVTKGAVATGGDIVLHQNRPNPYHTNTTIEFELPVSDQITLRVLDITGKVLLSETANYGKGIHQWRIDRDQLSTHSGVLYYQLTNNELTLTRKMVMVQ